MQHVQAQMRAQSTSLYSLGSLSLFSVPSLWQLYPSAQLGQSLPWE